MECTYYLYKGECTLSTKSASPPVQMPIKLFTYAVSNAYNDPDK